MLTDAVLVQLKQAVKKSLLEGLNEELGPVLQQQALDVNALTLRVACLEEIVKRLGGDPNEG